MVFVLGKWFIHNHLISEIEPLNIGNPLLSWLQSYLSPRMQFVKIHGATSDLSITPSGVPQGGHLSPLLFIVFINSINNYLSFSKVLLFVDDLILPDPSLMIKLVRNCFGEKRTFVDNNNEIIDYEFIENLLMLQDKENCHLSNKFKKITYILF